MKKRLLTMSVLAALSGHLMADEFGYMVFTLNDGTMKSITASGLTLSFTDGNLSAKSGNNELTIPLNSLKVMAFSKNCVTAIGDTMAYDDSEEIYDLQGHRVTRAEMRKGVYIIKTKNRTYKVNIR